MGFNTCVAWKRLDLWKFHSIPWNTVERIVDGILEIITHGRSPDTGNAVKTFND
jgi:hypothetical protein